MQTASLANPDAKLPKGLFTKELEVALLNGDADLAVHSLKDLPTELPDGLQLGAVTEREDPRDVLVCRGQLKSVEDFPEGATVASSSPRRQAQCRHAVAEIVRTTGMASHTARRSGDEEAGLCHRIGRAIIGSGRAGGVVRDPPVHG